MEAPPNIIISFPPKSTIEINGSELFSLVDGLANIKIEHLFIDDISKIEIGNKHYSKAFNLFKNISIKNEIENFNLTKLNLNKEIYKYSGAYISGRIDKLPKPFKFFNNKGEISLCTNSEQLLLGKNKINYYCAPYSREFRDKELEPINTSKLVRPIDLFVEYLSIRKTGGWKVLSMVLDGVSR
ncbi:hypothetical protein H1D32_24125 [Anaerobacillus sp. CMMVII]|uniref:hypothetical protein n=1 Tax=Anaerobacillus sp. CMMVII TaxID=2755588 RepID=UPI0021B839CC|nr:hypothetical protein [Anaerobacillus sp. CMMVII]MCT8140488.1 hypothetical protein [Anaerobacillus sp. CMMVII]